MSESQSSSGSHDGSFGAPGGGGDYPPLNRSTAIDRVGSKTDKVGGAVDNKTTTTAVDINTGKTITVDLMPLSGNPKESSSVGKGSHEGSQKSTPDTGSKPSAKENHHKTGRPNREGQTINFEQRNSGENNKNTSTLNFTDIQTELKSLINNPNPTREKELKIQRARLVKAAKSAHIFETVKVHMERVQTSATFVDAIKIIKGIDIEAIETEAGGIDKWKDEYEGMIREYVEVAILNMDLALAEEGGGNYTSDAARLRSIHKLKREIDIRGWGFPPPNLNKLAREFLNPVEASPQHQGKENEMSEVNLQILKKLTEISKHQERAANLQDEQLELMKKGLKGFIHGVVRRSHVSPEQYDQQLPPWFEAQGNEKQKMLTNILHINYLAAVKRDTGMASLDGWLGTPGLSIERDSLDFMNRNLPGFREALATMKQEIFIQGANHLIISEQGYKLVGSEELLNKYKLELTNKIATILKLKFGDFYEKEYRVSNEDLAALSVATVDNFFFGMGAYDSGDEARKIAPGDKNVYSGAIRTSMMPGINAKAKWSKNESFGGKLGDWMRENIKYDRGFRNRFNKGKIDFIPDRIYYSGLDHCDFEKTSKLKYQTLAEVLLSRDMVVYENGVYDFKDGADAVPFKELAGHDILGYYADVRGSAVKLYKHITIAEPKDRTLPGLVDALTKIKGDKLLAPLTKNEDFILACIAMVASPETGFVRGTTKTVIDVDTSIHGTKIFNAINDAKLFQGMKFGSRNKILNRLYYDVLFEKSRLERIKRIADRNAYRISHPSLLRRLINAIFRQ